MVTQRWLNPSQRLAAPFVFRSGGRKAWSVAEAVQIMDRARADGIFHLRNGSLIRWLEEQGAADLANAARESLRRHGADSEAALESFLIDSGLVKRPQLWVRPGRLDLGYLLPDEKGTAILRLQKQRGRGYLYGIIHPGERWLRVTPERFSGNRVDVRVQVDTRSLPLRLEPYVAHLLVASSATSEPIRVPVRFWLVGIPTRWQRFLLRPLTGLLTLGAAGLPLGVLWEGWVGGWPVDLPAGLQAGVIGLSWALLGGLLGWRQPLAWPLRYALRRWWTRIGGWMAWLSLMALLIVGIWPWLLAPLGIGFPPFGPLAGVILALSLSVAPAVVQEMGEINNHGGDPLPPSSRWRSVRKGAAILAATLLLLMGGQFAVSTWQQQRAEGRVDLVQGSVEAEWRTLERWANTRLDELTVRYYEQRRRPSPSLTPEWLQRWWRRVVYE